MCGRFTLNATPEIIAKTFNLQEIPDIELRYNIAPSQPIAVVRQLEVSYKLDLLKWGLIPGWSKEDGHPMINARSETVHEKPAFKHAIKYNRCIIPATGFYEWQLLDDHKQPYYIRLLNSGIMAFAGLWEKSKTEDGSEIETCCILTTSSNEVIRPIHDRMPVVLQPEDYGLWMNRKMHDTAELNRLYQPYPAEMMVTHKVPDLVNNHRFDGPSCILQM